MKAYTILLISKDTETNKTVKEILQEKEAILHIVSNVEQAIEEDIKDLDVILFDADRNILSTMPLQHKLRHHDTYHDVPVLLICDRNDESTIVAGYGEGFVDHIGRPILEEELLSRVSVNIKISKVESNYSQLSRHYMKFAEFASTFLYNISDGICLTDSFGKIISVNDAVVRLFKYDTDEMVGKSILDLLHLQHHPLYKHCFDGNKDMDYQLSRSFGHLHELEGVCKTGEVIPIDFSVSRVSRESGNFVCVINDSRIHKQMVHEYKQLAGEDFLTKLPNRRMFGETFDKTWKNAIRYAHPVSMLIIDIDHFKLYNDTYGHLSGDHCLKRIANTIRACCNRPTDFCARFGGEEFIMLLGDTSIPGAIHVAERINERLAKSRIEHKTSPVQAFVTASIGINSIVPTTQDSQEAFMEEMDEALYQAKASGKNRYVVNENIKKRDESE